MGLFVVVSGIPASGKSTLGRHLALALGLPLLDKDDLLDALLCDEPVTSPTHRRRLSRESDEALQRAAVASSGAVLVSHWRVASLAAGSGTPTGWLAELRRVVEVRCSCPAAVAAARFVGRQRLPGHLDALKNEAALELELTGQAATTSLGVGAVVHVDTSGAWLLDDIVRSIHAIAPALEKPGDRG